MITKARCDPMSAQRLPKTGLCLRRAAVSADDTVGYGFHICFQRGSPRPIILHAKKNTKLSCVTHVTRPTPRSLPGGESTPITALSPSKRHRKLAHRCGRGCLYWVRLAMPSSWLAVQLSCPSGSSQSVLGSRRRMQRGATRSLKSST